MLHALHTLQNRMPTKRQLALEAIHLEQELIGEAVGSQDQTAAAFGGLNLIRFNRLQEIEVDPIVVSRERLNQLQENLLLVFTGFSRTASDVAREQISATEKKSIELQMMNQLCGQALHELVDPNGSLDEFGRLLNEQWKIKRTLTNRITSPLIDEIYEQGIENGALGGKLLGAGGGGFMLFYVPKVHRAALDDSMKGKMVVPFRFENTGSKIIYFSHD
jgi:D-glycero-alpha-D-manno-heptose-7-phosphate kinase